MGCRGFAGCSLCKAFTRLGITEPAERASRGLWIGRRDRWCSAVWDTSLINPGWVTWTKLFCLHLTQWKLIWSSKWKGVYWWRYDNTWHRYHFIEKTVKGKPNIFFLVFCKAWYKTLVWFRPQAKLMHIPLLQRAPLAIACYFKKRVLKKVRLSQTNTDTVSVPS